MPGGEAKRTSQSHYEMNRICVFCGAGLGARREFAQAATALGRLMADRGLGLVYGGTRIGLMGQLADAVLDAGGEAIGVLPQSLVEREIAHGGLTKLHVVDSLAERKQLMHDLCDAFAALPGGLGTLDELSEMLTWAQLGFHQKPLGLLNVASYFDGLLAFLRHAVREGLVRQAHLDLLKVATTPQELLWTLAGGAAAGSRAQIR